MTDSNAAELRTVAILTWGDPVATARYVGDVQDVTLVDGGEGRAFAAAPEMAWDNPVLDAVLGDNPAKLAIGRARLPAATLARHGLRHAPIVARVGRCDPTNSNSLEILARRDVIGFEEGEAPGCVKLLLASPKRRIAGAVSLPVSGECPFRFGGRGCGYAVPLDTATVDSIDGNAVTFSGLGRGSVAVAGGDASPWYYRGAVTVDGLTIGEDGGADTLRLAAEPPPEWEGKAATVRAGCDKSREDCRDKWANIDRFGGIGIAMEPRHPLIDS